MADLPVLAAVADSIDLYLTIADAAARSAIRGFHLTRLYGLPGIVLLFFGNRTTWQIEAQVLGKRDDKEALDFKKSVQDECTMISVAVRGFHFPKFDSHELTSARLPSWRRLP